MNKFLSTIFTIVIAFLVFPPSVLGASPSYSRILDVSGDTMALENGFMDKDTYRTCSLTTMVCGKGGLARPTLASPFSILSNRSVFYDSKKSKAITVTRQVINKKTSYKVNYYVITGTTPKLLRTLPVTQKVTRVYWPEHGFVAGLAYGTTLSTYDLSTGKMIATLDFSSENKLDITLSPRGDTLVYVQGKKQLGSNERVYTLLDLVNNKTYLYKTGTEYWDVLLDSPRTFAYAPDGKTFLLLDNMEGEQTLYTVSIEESKIAGVIEKKRFLYKSSTINDFIFTETGDLLYLANEETNPLAWNIWKREKTTNTDSVLLRSVSYLHAIRKTQKGYLVYQINGPSFVPIYVDGKTYVTKSFKNIPLGTEDESLVREVLEVGDGAGVLVKKKNFTSGVPIIVWLHGGPYRQTSIGYNSYGSYAPYDWMLDEAVKKGAVVFKFDYPGSFGYTKKYSESVRLEVGGYDVEMVKVAVDKLKEKFPTSPLYVVGNSYGGYLALRVPVEYPGLFAGALSINGVSDWKLLLLGIQNSIFNTHFDGLPNPLNNKLYDQASVVSRVDKLKKEKMVIAYGTADKTIYPDQSIYIHNIFKKNGKNSTLEAFEGEDHVFYRQTSIERLCGILFKLTELPSENSCKIQ